MPLFKGVTEYMTSLAVAAEIAKHPCYVFSPMLHWNQHETAKGVFSTATENALKAAIDAAAAADVGLILRTTAGIDSPIGDPNSGSVPAWLTTHASPVSRIRTLDNDPSSTLYGKERYVPNLVGSTSRANYLTHLGDWYTRLATILNANGTNGFPRKNSIVMVTVPGPEDGTEMSLGYGSQGDTTYTGSATLSTAMGSGTTLPQTIKLAGSYGAYPSGAAIVQVGTELIHQTARSGNTITVGKRAHSGSSAAAHSVGAVVKYGSAHVTTTTFNGYGPAPYDHRAVNRAAWATLGNEATCTTAVAAYWTSATAAIAAAIPSTVGVSVAGGQIFGDSLTNAKTLIDSGPVVALGARFYAMTTNLQDGYAYDTTHPNEHAYLMKAVGHGMPVVCQTASVAVMPEPPAAGALQNFIASCEFARETYGMVILETGQRRFGTAATETTIAVGGVNGWGGGTGSQRDYLIIDAA